ncbi:Autophagy-related 9 [Carabus blaptoides fortunei]
MRSVEGLHTQVDCEETPQQSGLHTYAPESGQVHKSPIPDLDLFFSRIYNYHQKHGFTCMMLQEGFELAQFVFVVSFSTFLIHCVDYPVLFRDRVNNSTSTHKVTLSDAILSSEQSLANFGLGTWICLLVALFFWALRFIKVLYHLSHFWDIKSFFNDTLKIDDSQLDNFTWYEVQERVRNVQREDPITIYKPDLSELDIYHRILRFKNYMVAMVNKGLIPAQIRVPYVGDVLFLTQGLKYNLEMILFWGPWSPFQDNWHVKEDYKQANKRKELAADLSKHILWIAIANLILCPLILLWQILYAFFNYAEIIKREPGSLGTRCWSIYGRLYLRHFNELDHELNARLNRAYRPASKYMNIFTSPLKTVIAKNVGFLCGAVLAVLLILTVYDEDVLAVEHVLTTITVLGSIVAACRVFIPDENLVWCPEKLMTEVLAHVHYLPDSWRGAAHTDRVRNEFGDLFQYRVIYLVQELVSPIVTPFILWFNVRSRSLDIVDFYRNFTVTVEVGDVCSFAQMDVRKHGNPDWQNSDHSGQFDAPEIVKQPQPAINYAEDGKTELSLIHFTLTNPKWQMPSEAEAFVKTLRKNALKELDHAQPLAQQPGALMSSLHTVSSISAGYNSVVASIIQNAMMQQSNTTSSRDYFTNANIDTATGEFNAMLQTDLGESAIPGSSMSHTQESMSRGDLSTSHLQRSAVKGGLNRAEGPIFNDNGLLHSLHQSMAPPSMGASIFGPSSLIPTGPDDVVPLEYTAADMSLSTLYLHALHQQRVRRRGNRLRHMFHQHSTSASVTARSENVPDSHSVVCTVPTGIASGSSRLAESTPLLGKKR